MTTIASRLKERFLGNPKGDLIGGLMAAVVALPLCLAFGVASGLGAAAGLYGAIACGILAAAFGGTAGQCSGPTGPMTVVAAAMFSAYQDRPQVVFAAVILAGLLQLLMGRMRVGQLINYVPYPVISGFMTGIGVIIICIQIAPLFGLPASGSVVSSLQALPSVWTKANLQALLLSVVTLATIYLFPLISKRVPTFLNCASPTAICFCRVD
jgi:SulP family sulfate permease